MCNRPHTPRPSSVFLSDFILKIMHPGHSFHGYISLLQRHDAKLASCPIFLIIPHPRAILQESLPNSMARSSSPLPYCGYRDFLQQPLPIGDSRITNLSLRHRSVCIPRQHAWHTLLNCCSLFRCRKVISNPENEDFVKTVFHTSPIYIST